MAAGAASGVPYEPFGAMRILHEKSGKTFAGNGRRAFREKDAEPHPAKVSCPAGFRHAPRLVWRAKNHGSGAEGEPVSSLAFRNEPACQEPRQEEYLAVSKIKKTGEDPSRDLRVRV